MNLLFFHAPEGNFGDDLNELIWKEVLPDAIWTVPDVTLVGIGTLLNADRINRETVGDHKVYVLGTGAGYGALPEGIADASRYRILALRGPLSARLTGRADAAVTDGAALLRTLPHLVPARRPGTIAFIPHVSSLKTGLWPQVCKSAGMEMIDPRWTPEKVFDALSRTRLVVAEAMHGAIVADTLRIPWVPATSSRRIFSFKWQDWTSSLALPYDPVRLPPSSGFDAVRHFNQGLRAKPGNTIEDSDPIAWFNKRYGSAKRVSDDPMGERSGRRSLKDRILKGAGLADRIFIERAAKALSAAAAREPVLSRDSVLDEKVNRLLGAVDVLKRELLSAS